MFNIPTLSITTRPRKSCAATGRRALRQLAGRKLGRESELELPAFGKELWSVRVVSPWLAGAMRNAGSSPRGGVRVIVDSDRKRLASSLVSSAGAMRRLRSLLQRIIRPARTSVPGRCPLELRLPPRRARRACAARSSWNSRPRRPRTRTGCRGMQPISLFRQRRPWNFWHPASRRPALRKAGRWGPMR